MPKKKVTEELETTTEVGTPTEVISEAPTLSESEQIVVGNAELIQLKKDIAESRAEFVKQTDKQFTKIKELDETIASKQSKVDEYNALIDSIPEAQKKVSEARNEATRLIAQAEASMAEVLKRENAIEKTTAEIAKQKEANTIKANELEIQATSLNEREKNLNTAAKEIIAFKNAMGKI